MFFRRSILSLLVCISLILSFSVTANAQTTIYLTNNGWSNPNVGSWDPINRVATLDSNSTLNVKIEIKTHNVTLNGNGSTLTGNLSGNGLYLYNINNATVKNLTVSSFLHGVFVRYGSRNKFENCTTMNNNGNGLYINRCPSFSFIGNKAYGNLKSGFLIQGTPYGTVTGNESWNNEYGMQIVSGSDGQVLTANTVYGNKNNFYFNSYHHTIDTSNTVEGKPFRYYRGISDITIDSSVDVGFIAFISCNNVTVKDISLSNNGQGVLFYRTNDSRIENVTVTGGRFGLFIMESHRNTLINNKITENLQRSIWIAKSTNNEITANQITNGSNGIFLGSSAQNNQITNNTITNTNGSGVVLDWGVSSNTISNNSISNNSIGINISRAPNNTFRNNLMVGNLKNLNVNAYQIPEFDNDIDISNKVNGKPVYYLLDKSDMTIGASENPGYVALVNCNNITVKDVDLSNNGNGVLVAFSTIINIENVTANNCRNGFFLLNSDTISVTGGNFRFNDNTFRITGSENGIINNNNFESPSDGWGWLGRFTIANSKYFQIFNNNFYFSGWSPGNVQNNCQEIAFNLEMPVGGNFWSMYTEPDAEGDGIVDIPYIKGRLVDNFPWTTENGWAPKEPTIDDLMDFVTNSGLSAGRANSLKSKLENVKKMVEKENSKAACNKLGAFINEVKAFMKTGKISEETGQEWIDIANSLIDKIKNELGKGGIIAGDIIPNDYEIAQNYPNPFNPETNISYQLPEASKVVLKIYSLTGQEIKTLVSENKPAGFHSVKWDGTNSNGIKVNSGVFIYRITAGSFYKTMKMILIK
jgi:parallel beta-helix repeat protein